MPGGPALPPALPCPPLGRPLAILPSRPPTPTYPLGHLMVGMSFRNQGRYRWNCSTVGRTVPVVKLMQVFKQAREPANRAGAPGSSTPRARQPLPGPACAHLPSRPPCRSRHAGSRGMAFAPNEGRSSPLGYGNCRCPLAREEGQFGAEKPLLWGLSYPPASAAARGQGPTPTPATTPAPTAHNHQCAQRAWAQLRKCMRV